MSITDKIKARLADFTGQKVVAAFLRANPMPPLPGEKATPRELEAEKTAAKTRAEAAWLMNRSAGTMEEKDGFAEIEAQSLARVAEIEHLIARAAVDAAVIEAARGYEASLVTGNALKKKHEELLTKDASVAVLSRVSSEWAETLRHQTEGARAMQKVMAAVDRSLIKAVEDASRTVRVAEQNHREQASTVRFFSAGVTTDRPDTGAAKLRAAVTLEDEKATLDGLSRDLAEALSKEKRARAAVDAAVAKLLGPAPKGKRPVSATGGAS